MSGHQFFTLSRYLQASGVAAKNPTILTLKFENPKTFEIKIHLGWIWTAGLLSSNINRLHGEFKQPGFLSSTICWTQHLAQLQATIQNVDLFLPSGAEKR